MPGTLTQYGKRVLVPYEQVSGNSAQTGLFSHSSYLATATGNDLIFQVPQGTKLLVHYLQVVPSGDWTAGATSINDGSSTSAVRWFPYLSANGNIVFESNLPIVFDNGVYLDVVANNNAKAAYITIVGRLI